MERTTGTQIQPGPAVTQIDSNLDVTAKVTAPTMLIGDTKCNIALTSDNTYGERLLITLPSDGKLNGASEDHKPVTYDMRSIIEAIQELNRRTATFNCNVTFNSALEAFDTVKDDEALTCFACDQDKDGLPAAHPGEFDIEVANGPYNVTLTNSDGESIYTISEATAARSITISLDDTQIQELYEALAEIVGETPPQLELIYTPITFVLDVNNGTSRASMDIMSYNEDSIDDPVPSHVEFGIHAVYTGVEGRYSSASADAGYMTRSALTGRSISVQDCYLRIYYVYDSELKQLWIICDVHDSIGKVCTDATGSIELTVSVYAQPSTDV